MRSVSVCIPVVKQYTVPLFIATAVAELYRLGSRVHAIKMLREYEAVHGAINGSKYLGLKEAKDICDRIAVANGPLTDGAVLPIQNWQRV